MDGAQHMLVLVYLHCVISSIQIHRSRPPSLVPNPSPRLGFRARRRLRRRCGSGVPGGSSPSSTVPPRHDVRVSFADGSSDAEEHWAQGAGCSPSSGAGSRRRGHPCHRALQVRVMGLPGGPCRRRPRFWRAPLKGRRSAPVKGRRRAPVKMVCSEATATIPCTARNQFNDKSILKFKENGHRYVADLYCGHEVTLIGGDGWEEFRRECDVHHGQVVVFIMEGRMAKAYITQDFGVVEGEEEGEGADGEEEGEAAEEVEVMDEEDDDHEVGAAATFENTSGFVFEADEYATMEALLAIEDGYLGPHFAHRLTPTNVTKKLMKIPMKIVQPRNLDAEGVIGLCMGAGDVMEVAYRMDIDRRMVFNKQWGVFVAQNHLEVNAAVAFNFRENNAQGVNLICVVNP